MTDNKNNDVNEFAADHGVEELHYEEQPVMTTKDTIGVAVAVLALGVIGFLGYNWLTPGKSITTMLKPPSTIVDEAAVQESVSSSAVQEHIKCATCGMFADKSASHVVIEWSDGTSTHHDSWDCAFGFSLENGMEMLGTEISHFGSPIESPHFLDATQAWYLYDTDEPVEGSMPPFVAAFASKGEAGDSLGQMGGEVLDYAGLAAKWGVEHTNSGESSMPSKVEGHDMAGMDSSLDEQADPTESESTLKPHEHDHSMSCTYCGMFADKSKSHVMASWSDESHTHHDCWDCVMFYGSEGGLSLLSAEVALIDSPLSSPEWMDANSAWFLYDTDKSVKGSMPPFVAAFQSMEAASNGQGEWGGEVVDFAGLIAKWN